jgi:hypothetical protein
MEEENEQKDKEEEDSIIHREVRIPAASSLSSSEEVTITTTTTTTTTAEQKTTPSSTIILEGNLSIPKKDTKGIVVFAHGSGSSRNSPRNQYVAQVLNKDGLATLLVDLLTPEEEESDNKIQKISHKIPGVVVLNKFNINLLAKRFVSITDWVLQNPSIQNLIVGYLSKYRYCSSASSCSSSKT